MQHVDEARLENDLSYRFAYLTEFIGFDADDLDAVHAAAEHLAGLVPTLVDAVYDKLFGYDATKRHFVTRQDGYEGPVPASLEQLDQEHDLIKYRKQHLARYLTALVTRDYDERMQLYLDMVGKIHTRDAGNPQIVVPLVQMDALMGFVSDALLSTILSLNLDREAEIRTLRAFNKLLWIQNDLIARHYVGSGVGQHREQTVSV